MRLNPALLVGASLLTFACGQGADPSDSTQESLDRSRVAFGINLRGDPIGAGRTAGFALERIYHNPGDRSLDSRELALIAKGVRIHTSIKGSGSWQNVTNGGDDAALTAFLLDLKARGGVAVYFSFHHEMDGDDSFGTPEQYAAAAQHVWQLAQTLKVNHGAGGNVFWVWNVTGFGARGPGYAFPQRITPYYPGDPYVDFIGADIYNFDGCVGRPLNSFHDAIQGILDWRVAQKHWKPIFLPEVGSVRGSSATSQADWVRAMAVDLQTASRSPVVAIEYWSSVATCDTSLNAAGIAAYQALGKDPYFGAPLP